MSNYRESKIDILNRGEFIQRTVDIVKLISSHQGNMTFAIDGAWGCGKTFVLEEIERRLENDSSKNYLVIPYNCWQYDYYDEPLVALVAALKDFADSTKPIPEDAKTQIKHIFGTIGLKLFSQIIKNKVGIDSEELISTFKEAFAGASDAVEVQHEFDTFYGFRQVLTELNIELRALTEKYTLVLAVDELDRCLPEYAIKVLERLHHITGELSNTVTIISVDKVRLSNTIDSIFGANSADDYLKKFIRFTITLDNGKQNGQAFFDKFPEFKIRFDASLYKELNGGKRFLEELFDGISPREQEQIVEKATIFNDVCFGTEKQDYTMMYMELFLATLHYHCQDNSFYSDKKLVSDSQNVFHHIGKMPSAFKTQNSGFCFHGGVYVDHKGQVLVIDPTDVFRIVFMYWYDVPEPKYDAFHGTGLRLRMEKEEPRLTENIIKLREKIHLLEIIQ